VRKLTRRGLLGIAAVATVSAAGYGRFAVGDEFEEHVASVLGLPVEPATDLTESARERLGDLEYDRLASSFLFVTTLPGRWITPEGARRRAVNAFLSEAVPDSRGNLVLLGLQRGGASVACKGLLQT
jgi:hypothetical protein